MSATKAEIMATIRASRSQANPKAKALAEQRRLWRETKSATHVAELISIGWPEREARFNAAQLYSATFARSIIPR